MADREPASTEKDTATPRHITLACGVLARAWESENDPRNAELGVSADVAREMSVAAQREEDRLRAILADSITLLDRVLSDPMTPESGVRLLGDIGDHLRKHRGC